MKVSGKVLQAKEKDGKKAAFILMNGALPKVGDLVVVKWGKKRTTSQNSFYWVFLDWLMEAGLKDEYANSDELHETLKAAFLSKKHFTKTGKEVLKIGSTTNLGKMEFGEYMDKVNLAASQYWGIDTSEFWKEYEQTYKMI